MYNTWLEQTVVFKNVLDEFKAMKKDLQQLQKTVFHHHDELKRDLRTLQQDMQFIKRQVASNSLTRTEDFEPKDQKRKKTE